MSLFCLFWGGQFRILTPPPRLLTASSKTTLRSKHHLWNTVPQKSYVWRKLGEYDIIMKVFCKDDIVRFQLQNWTFSVKLETQIWSGNCAIKSDAKKVLFAPRLLHNLQLSVPHHSHPIKLGPKEQAEKQTVDEFFLWFQLVMFKVYSLHHS